MVGRSRFRLRYKCSQISSQYLACISTYNLHSAYIDDFFHIKVLLNNFATVFKTSHEMKYKTTFDIFNNLFIGINDDFVLLHITFNQDNHWFKIH